MTAANVAPRAMKQAGPAELAVSWNDGHESVYPVRLLRLACRCANCMDESSGAPLLDPARVAKDVRPVVINPVGRYGVQIQWSDGHATGIYTFEHLRSLCPCATCAAAAGA
jgi:ATP-binding protein involved in chromosome partitioning